ncbi:elicitor-responsive protein 1 [Sesamum indicum]|uniref:Elicitor-responsive protein 1 n=1 Tax=Sesamum indicum TaxID=4182 RepID=A0A6I9TYN5_SESIN|nr:elicitor-responsive protein 1 [Sesamum indicum]
MSIPVQGQVIEVTVVGCNQLKNTEWISKQDPYVCLEYGHTKYRTRTCQDGGKNPNFQERFVFTLREGMVECVVEVWNSNRLSVDDFIGGGRIQLMKAPSQGVDDGLWPLMDKKGRPAGEVRIMMRNVTGNNAAGVGGVGMHGPSAPAFTGAPPLYSPPPPFSQWGPSAGAPPGYHPPSVNSYQSFPSNPPAYPNNSPGYPPYAGGFAPPPGPYPPQNAYHYPPGSSYPPHPY